MRKPLISLLPVLAIAILLGLLYSFFKPMAFLLVFGIVLSIIFVTQAISFGRYGNLNPVAQNSLARISVLILGVLFMLSMKVLHDYQNPSGDEPYFTNADHHAIQNVGVSFNEHIILYSDEKLETGLWNSEIGSLVLAGKPSGAKLISTDFYTPIFKVENKRSTFLNSAWRTPIQPGFRIKNNLSELQWTKFSGDNDGQVEMEVMFITSDPQFSPSRTFRDTFHIETTIRKGISLKYLLQQLDKSSAVEIEGPVFQWLNQVGEITLIANTDDKFYLQPSAEMIKDRYICSLNSVSVPLTRRQEIDLGFREKFYVGLARSRYPLMLEAKNGSEYEKLVNRAYLLRFEEQNLIPFFNVPSGERKVGQKYLRFMKNNYDLGALSEVREGFMFQRSMKVNNVTTVSGLFEFEIDKTGVPIKWKKNNEKEEQSGLGSFFLQSASGQNEWIYGVRDLSDNWFSFDIIKYYLFFIILGMMALVVFFPSAKTIAIETPLLVLIYCFVVFRYLLIWRVATFPPLENIKKTELEGTLRQFDNLLTDVPSSLTFLMVLVFLIMLAVYRKLPTLRDFMVTKKPYQLTWYYLIFILSCCLLAFIPIEQILRITRIAIPLLGYLFFSFKAIRSNQDVPFETSLGSFGRKLVPFVRVFISSDMFFISLITLVYFGLLDTGFAVIFFMFLLIRFSIFSLLRLKLHSIDLVRDIFPLGLTLGLLLTLLFWKGTIHFLLTHVLIFIALGGVVFALVRYLLKPVILIPKWKFGFILVPLLIALASLVPYTGEYISDAVNDKVRMVKYRAELIYQPMENVLFNNKFQSNQEAKILETAQSQWFIHTFLKGVNFFDFTFNNELIKFRTHFKTGVDYSTQTRDVVLPRYVIGEFGGFTMSLLLILCTIPMIICLWMYKMTSTNKTTFLPDSSIVLMAMVFLFTSALMLWLTSTNRFVFFGQDFPFLSITSRVSVLIPLGLCAAVLLTSPQRLNSNEITLVGRLSPVIIFFILIAGVIFASGKSVEMAKDEYFKVDFSRVETNVNNQINSFLETAQTSMKLGIPLNSEGLPKKQWVSEIGRVVNRMFQNKAFLALYNDSLSVYEKSLWDILRKDPSIGIRLNSPIHFKVDEGLLRCVFNPYWRLELPPYDERTVWKGDVAQSADFSSSVTSPLVINEADVRLIRIPYSFLRKPMDLGILTMDNFIKQSGSAFVYDVKQKAIEGAGASFYAKLIDSSDIVFRPDGEKVSAFTVYGGDKNYFARNILLNGKQQMIYPLGSTLYWARHWALSTKNKLEKSSGADLEQNTSITLDYALTREVGMLIDEQVPPAVDSKIKDAAFAVIAADGEGKIRLLNDYAQQRKKIDPNHESEIQDEQLKSYFYVDVAKERLQWGNLNLLRMTQGPGSAFKPILAAAVISTSNAGWQNLKYLKNYKHPIDSIFDFENGISYYAGEKLEGKWKGLAPNNVNTDFRDYIVRSNNLYHSLMVFLGSYTLKQINEQGNDIKRLLIPFSGSKYAFPILEMGGTKYELPAFQNWPKSDSRGSYFANRNAVMYQGLVNHFGLESDLANGLGILKRRQNFSKLNDTTNVWAYPEYSYMLLSKRITIDDVKDNFNKAIRQTTLGGGGVFDITPLKMAQMFGVLASMNPKFELTIDDKRSKDGKFNPDPKWGDDGYSEFHYGTLLSAMKGVLETGGTAAGLLSKINNPERSKYHFYAKTGTIGSEDGIGNNKNSKRLGIIISREPLTSSSASNKFYVVYFRFDNARLDKQIDDPILQIYASILDKILSSASFKNYMGN